MEKEIIYSTYTPAMKECIKKYRNKNKEKINEKNKEYYHKKMENPEYKKKMREQARLRYQKRKNNQKLD